jgi:hypothetical protein
MTIPAPGGPARRGGGGGPPTRRWLAPAALALVAAAPLAGAAAPAAAPGRPDREADLLAFAQAFAAAWSAHDLEAVFALFAPEAVITFDSGPASDPEDGHTEYRGGGGPRPLRAGVAVLMGASVQVDPGGLQAAPVVFGGAPATVARWPYRHAALPPGPLPPVPPEVGMDEVVVRGGRIVAYTRTPDGEARVARARALERATSAVALRSAHPTAAPAGAAQRSPEATGAVWPLGLAGLGASAALLVRWRRRQARPG